MSTACILILFIACFARNTDSLALRWPIHQHNRRAFVASNVAAIAITGRPIAILAEESKIPFAPPQALLPVTRLKLWVDEVHALSREATATQDPEERFNTVQQINDRLSNPPKLFRGEKTEKRAPSSIAQLSSSISSANKGQYQLNRKDFNIGDKVTAMMNQADVERQWGMLQYAEAKREERNEMRGAFNFYTRQLTYSDAYTLTASKAERKQMIRNDELPTPTAVIASDLDRRDLYRNQFLTSIDDATAEAAYQAKQRPGEVDVAELVELMNAACAASANWFSLIGSRELEEAIQEVQSNKP